MYPIFTIFGKEYSMYALMAVIGMLVSGFVFCRRIKRAGYNDNDAVLFLLVLAGGVLVGGSFLYGIVNIKNLKLLSEVNGIGEALGVIGKTFGGSVFYGGLIFAIIAGLLFIRAKKLPRDLYFDSSAILAPLFHAFARVGCFFGGCCYGIESSFGFCAKGNSITDIGEVRRFPVQLLESGINLIIAITIMLLAKNGKLKGRLFYLYLCLYAFIRFFDEFLRGDSVRGFVFGLSTSQLISIIIEAVSLFLLFASKKKKSSDSLDK